MITNVWVEQVNQINLYPNMYFERSCEASRLTIIKNINLWKYQYENIAYIEKIFSDFIHYLETFNADKNRLKVYNIFV